LERKKKTSPHQLPTHPQTSIGRDVSRGNLSYGCGPPLAKQSRLAMYVFLTCPYLMKNKRLILKDKIIIII